MSSSRLLGALVLQWIKTDSFVRCWKCMETFNRAVDVKGSSVTYSVTERRASGPWVVFLHGLQTSKALFEDWMTQSCFSKSSVLSVDFIGFGESSKPKDFSYTIEEQALGIMALLDLSGISECHVVGHSMGGMVGTLLLELVPNKVLSLVSLEGNLQGRDCGESSKVAQLSYQEFSETHYPNLLRKLNEMESPSARVRRSSVSKVPAHAFFLAAREIVAAAESERLLKIFESTPHHKLLVVGQDSGFASRPESEVSKVVVIPDATHFMTLDQPERSLDVVRDFLVSVGAADSTSASK